MTNDEYKAWADRVTELETLVQKLREKLSAERANALAARQLLRDIHAILERGIEQELEVLNQKLRIQEIWTIVSERVFK